MFLTSTSDIVQVITGSAGTIKVKGDWVDFVSPSTYTPGRNNESVISTATTRDVIDPPGASTFRSVRQLSVRNTDAAVSNLITIQHTDGTTVEELWKGTLLAGEAVVYDKTGVFTLYDVNGNKKATVFPSATQAEMESPSSLAVSVTPGNMKWYPGVAKFVAMTTGTASPSLQTPPAFNMTSITDTGVGRLTVTIATDFSSANWCCLSQCEQVSTTLTEAGGNVMRSYIRQATLAAGTVEINCSDFTATTHVVRDPVSHHVVGFGDHA